MVNDPGVAARRDDLDLVRSLAMLLGIALHAALAYIPGGAWMVSDEQVAPLGMLVIGVHGFRMQLFFLLSGFFAAMLWQRRGLMGLVSQRSKRILLPLAIGCITILPLMMLVNSWAMGRQNAMVRSAETANGEARKESADLWAAAASGDLEALKKFAAAAPDVNAFDPVMGVTALGWTAIKDQPEAAAYLLSIGAKPSAIYKDGNTPLHTACFFGRAEVGELLLKAGADTTIVSAAGEKPVDSLRHDRNTTQYIANLVRTSIDFEKIAAGRERLRVMLGGAPADAVKAEAPAQEAPANGLVARLQQQQFFQHLWFLWFLCIFTAGFAAVAIAIQSMPRLRLPAVLFSMPWCLVWVVPITAVLQQRMHVGSWPPGFGPETSTGVIPLMPVLFYYAVFFAFGAMFFCIKGPQERLGRFWWLSMPLAFVLLPIMLVLAFMPPLAQGPLANLDTRRVLFNVVQAAYAWLMTLGVLGACEAYGGKVRPWVRYLSDSSYWLYLMHLPLVIFGQALLLSVPLPPGVKFVLLTGGVVVILLIAYHFLVRRTVIGVLLNGKRAA
jgi:peptidoglycan/LPS O-acetylase OafA/YrhL